LNLQESFDQGPAKDELYPNVWFRQSELPGFREFMEDYYQRCHQMHVKLLEALAISLDLPRSFFVKLCNQNTSELRLNHYPAVTKSTLWSGCNRISEHTDFGTFTLLFQDSVAGLEIENQDQYGEFIPIESIDITDMIVNVGDCLQRWTNDILRSANHRVTLPRVERHQGNEMINHRYSVAYFGKPNREASVRTMPEFVKSGAEPKYVIEMTMWEYNQVKLLRTY
jgi:isopenicillin N synthase-like dioxygenase